MDRHIGIIYCISSSWYSIIQQPREKDWTKKRSKNRDARWEARPEADLGWNRKRDRDKARHCPVGTSLECFGVKSRRAAGCYRNARHC